MASVTGLLDRSLSSGNTTVHRIKGGLIQVAKDPGVASDLLIFGITKLMVDALSLISICTGAVMAILE